MVDLHQALRPTETAPPPPVAEIAARAGRRRRRRRVVASTAGIAVVVGLASIGLGGLADRASETSTVADGASERPARSTGTTPSPETGERPDRPDRQGAPNDSSTPAPAPSSPTPSTAAPDSTPTTSAVEPAPSSTAIGGEPDTTAGLRTTTTRTSEWATGYCFQVEITNDGSNQARWQVVIDLAGTVSTVWNASAVTAGERTIFAGLADYNADLAAGQTTSFGACVATGDEP